MKIENLDQGGVLGAAEKEAKKKGKDTVITHGIEGEDLGDVEEEDEDDDPPCPPKKRQKRQKEDEDDEPPCPPKKRQKKK